MNVPCTIRLCPAHMQWAIYHYIIFGEKVSIKWRKYVETYAFMLFSNMKTRKRDVSMYIFYLMPTFPPMTS